MGNTEPVMFYTTDIGVKGIAREKLVIGQMSQPLSDLVGRDVILTLSGAVELMEGLPSCGICRACCRCNS